MRHKQRQRPLETTAWRVATPVSVRFLSSVAAAMVAARFPQTPLAAVVAVCSRLAVTAHLPLPVAVSAARPTATGLRGLVLVARPTLRVRLRRLVVLLVAGPLVTAVRAALTAAHPFGVVAVAQAVAAARLVTLPTLAALVVVQINILLLAAAAAQRGQAPAALVVQAQTETMFMVVLAVVAAALMVLALAVLAATVERPVVAVVAGVQALRPIAARAEMAATDRSW